MQQHNKGGRAFTELILETFQFNGRLLAVGDRLSKPVGLTSSRWQVLGAIEAQSLSVAQIARNMGLARQNVQRLADALEKQGIVEYAPNPHHKRAKLVCLTTRGRSAMRKLGEMQVRWANEIAAGIGVAEIEAASETLKKLRLRLLARKTGPLKN
jgi:DNA-binding MarR family transcriptional regulator